MMKKMMKMVMLALLVASIAVACTHEEKEKKLPFLGRNEYTDTDTIYHTIADFKFVDQDSNWVSNKTFDGKVYVADFFFTSCPTICPIMKAQMLRAYDSLENNDQVLFLSHTIDPKHDSVAVLKEFAERLGVTSDRWHFVTGDKDDIYKIGQTSYMVSAVDDPTQPGGYVHSGAFILVDGKRRVRGLYDGTKPEEVDKMLKDIDILLKEKEQ